MHISKSLVNDVQLPTRVADRTTSSAGRRTAATSSRIILHCNTRLDAVTIGLGI